MWNTCLAYGTYQRFKYKLVLISNVCLCLTSVYYKTLSYKQNTYIYNWHSKKNCERQLKDFSTFVQFQNHTYFTLETHTHTQTHTHTHTHTQIHHTCTCTDQPKEKALFSRSLRERKFSNTNFRWGNSARFRVSLRRPLFSLRNFAQIFRETTESFKKTLSVYFFFCFVWFVVLRPSQQLWSCRDGQLT